MSLPNCGWKNKKGTSDRSNCKCGSWKQHWINHSNEKWPVYCSNRDCNNYAEDGAHVYNSSISMTEYIVPLCKPCNQISNEEFCLKGGITLVPVNTSGC